MYANLTVRASRRKTQVCFERTKSICRLSHRWLYACPETLEAVIIDPGDEPERILKNIQEYKLIPKYIINIHEHFDHICAIDAVSAVYPVPLVINPDNVHMYTVKNTAQMFNP